MNDSAVDVVVAVGDNVVVAIDAAVVVAAAVMAVVPLLLRLLQTDHAFVAVVVVVVVCGLHAFLVCVPLQVVFDEAHLPLLPQYLHGCVAWWSRLTLGQTDQLVVVAGVVVVAAVDDAEGVAVGVPVARSVPDHHRQHHRIPFLLHRSELGRLHRFLRDQHCC